MEWYFLFAAILCELAGTTALKASFGYTRLVPSLLVVAFYLPAFWMLGLATKKIDVGVAYAIWSGMGTALMAVVGVFVFREILTIPKLAGLVLVIVGVVVLNRSGAGH